MPINDADDLSQFLTATRGNMGDVIDNLEASLAHVKEAHASIEAAAAYAATIDALEGELRAANDQIAGLVEAAETGAAILDAVRDRGVVHEMGCKFYTGATCQCLPRVVAEWLAI